MKPFILKTKKATASSISVTERKSIILKGHVFIMHETFYYIKYADHSNKSVNCLRDELS